MQKAAANKDRIPGTVTHPEFTLLTADDLIHEPDNKSALEALSLAVKNWSGYLKQNNLRLFFLQKLNNSLGKDTDEQVVAKINKRIAGIESCARKLSEFKAKLDKTNWDPEHALLDDLFKNFLQLQDHLSKLATDIEETKASILKLLNNPAGSGKL